MTENRLDIQTILTKRRDFHEDRVLLLGRVSDKNDEANLKVKQKRIK